MQLAKDGYLDKMGVTLLGTDAEAIDKAEDRQMFRDTMVKINQPVVPSDIAYTVDHAKEIADEIGYPVIFALLSPWAVQAAVWHIMSINLKL